MLPPTTIKFNLQSENRVKLIGDVLSVQDMTGPAFLPHVTMALQTKALGECTVSVCVASCVVRVTL